ncbi:hypothetical protein FRB94_000224 [Tulasnella sp. JGI-2019a]|nr:hypothetical protein FRB94_000224 [Tulasnella sp. JGI-2019a]KAG9015319.1 hypothetical protein FRB93_013019 [Tulasnella sp. JGI-2019a]KAG9039377.1 hypothetical protein FRB95_010665 [Tulasnella sp. JGI-2019a]
MITTATRGLGRLKTAPSTSLRYFTSQRPLIARTKVHNSASSFGQNHTFFTSSYLAQLDLPNNSSRSQFRYATAFALTSALLLYGVHTMTTPLHLESPAVLPGNEAVIESQETIVDPATSIAFPTTLRFPSPHTPPVTLIGVGVRTVSFLKIQVYAVGFYADVSDVDFKGLPVDRRIDWLIENRAVAIRLVPTRNTSFHHLRDAYVRSLHGRLRLAQKGTLTDEAEAEIETAVQAFKGFFTSANLIKNTPFYVLLASPDDKPRAVVLPTLQGYLRHTWTGVELMRAYFQEAAPSPAMKKSVMEGVEKL